MAAKRESRDVLRYTRDEKSRATVRRHYYRWRESQGLPLCCDIPGCVFEKEPLVWRGQALPLILDHANGVNSDDGPENLRLLCPNCDAQLDTRGGRNIGTVDHKAEGGFAIIPKVTGVRRYVLPADVSGSYTFSGSAATLVMHRLLPTDSSPIRIGGSVDAVLIERSSISDGKEPGSC